MSLPPPLPLVCFATLEAKLSQKKALSLSEITALYPEYLKSNPSARPLPSPSDTPVPSSAPLFVTWNIHPRGTPASEMAASETALRGCIGTFSAQPLADGLPSYALTSALEDTRFSPISLSDVPRLQVNITLLDNFEECADKYDWQIGKHGIIISFRWKGRKMSGTYLPDVMVEQGWDKDETLESLMHKAGWRGENWQEIPLEVTRYEGRKTGAEYGEWEAFRKWAESQK